MYKVHFQLLILQIIAMNYCYRIQIIYNHELVK